MIKLIAILVVVAIAIVYEVFIKGRAIKEKKKFLGVDFDVKNYYVISAAKNELHITIKNSYGRINDQFTTEETLNQFPDKEDKYTEPDGTPLSIGVFTYKYQGRNGTRTLYSRPFHRTDEEAMKQLLEKKETINIYVNKKNEHDYFIDI